MINLTLDDINEIRAIWSLGIRAHRTMQMGVHKKDRGPSADEIHEKHSARIFEILFSHVDEKAVEDTFRKFAGYDHGEFGHYLSSIYASPNVLITRALYEDHIQEIKKLSGEPMKYTFMIDTELPENHFRPLTYSGGKTAPIPFTFKKWVV